jgi:hypothetical protein
METEIITRTQTETTGAERCRTPATIGVLLAAAATISIPCAHADEGSLDGRTLGVAEGILPYCERLDPVTAARLRANIKRLVKGLPSASIARIRSGDDYHGGYQNIADFIAKVDDHNAHRACEHVVLSTKAP